MSYFDNIKEGQTQIENVSALKEAIQLLVQDKARQNASALYKAILHCISLVPQDNGNAMSVAYDMMKDPNQRAHKKKYDDLGVGKLIETAWENNDERVYAIDLLMDLMTQINDNAALGQTVLAVLRENNTWPLSKLITEQALTDNLQDKETKLTNLKQKLLTENLQSSNEGIGHETLPPSTTVDPESQEAESFTQQEPSHSNPTSVLMIAGALTAVSCLALWSQIDDNDILAQASLVVASLGSTLGIGAAIAVYWPENSAESAAQPNDSEAPDQAKKDNAPVNDEVVKHTIETSSKPKSSNLINLVRTGGGIGGSIGLATGVSLLIIAPHLLLLPGILLCGAGGISVLSTGIMKYLNTSSQQPQPLTHDTRMSIPATALHNAHSASPKTPETTPTESQADPKETQANQLHR